MGHIQELDLKHYSSIITDELLKGSKSIRKLTIAKHISKLPIGAFSSCVELKKVYFEPGSILKTLPEYSFANCSSLVKINALPDDLVSIENYAFQNCNNIEDIIIPKNVLFVGEHAFDGWGKHQIIRCHNEYNFGSKCQASIINISKQIETGSRDNDVFIEDGLEFFIVKAKCGHVGRPYYIPIDFPVKASDAKEAAAIVRKFGRVKHDHKDAILDVRQVNKMEYKTQCEANNVDPYLCVKSKHNQNDIFEKIKDRLVSDPHYKPKKDKRYVKSQQSGLSVEYKKQKINKESAE